MTDSTFDAATAAAGPADVAALAKSMPDVARGARWFWWIAAFTAINAALIVGQSHTSFVLGLAFTQIAHQSLAVSAALVVDALLVGGFFLAGLKAQSGNTVAFVLGALVYAADALVYVAAAHWLPVVIHVLVLFYIANGFMALQRAKKATGLG